MNNRMEGLEEQVFLKGKTNVFGQILLTFLLSWLVLTGCGKDEPKAPQDFSLSFKVNGAYNGTLQYRGVKPKPVVQFDFTQPVNSAQLESSIQLKDEAQNIVPITTTLQNDNKLVVVTPKNNLKSFTTYQLTIANTLQSQSGGKLLNPLSITLQTGLDSTDKFARISDEALLDLVQRQTFKYFWEAGHPVSGMARERATSGETVTTGGTGFGIMAIISAIHRGFITRAEGLARIQKIVDFLEKADKFKGAFPHWLNGTTGKMQPFSAKDDGADLVETSFLMQGLLTARQFFSGADATEATLRMGINALWNAVEWNWFTKGGGNVLYWHWSPNNNWEVNLPIRGWNESLVTYVLAAASPNYTIDKKVYDEGWARSGGMRNGGTFYGHTLPLGPSHGGPLFFAHYSFLGINPKGLTDAYADYWLQARAHALIHYEYAKANPKGFAGYSDAVWGLTASDDNKVGYQSHSPANDNGVVAPTAALASMPYTPEESMKALRFYYYVLGDKLWKEYGFVDAFNLTDNWFATSFLAIDQGPIIVMIENHRSGLLWNLFMSAPEVKAGLRKLGFQSPNL